MREIRLESGVAQDKYASDRKLLARLRIFDEEIAVWVGDEGRDQVELVAPVWEHTVFELENLAKALEFVALGHLFDYYSVSSPDCLIGPTIRLWPAIHVEVGHPGCGSGPSAEFYFFAKDHFLGKRKLIYASVILDKLGEEVIFEVADALALAEAVYLEAKLLAERIPGLS